MNNMSMNMSNMSMYEMMMQQQQVMLKAAMEQQMRALNPLQFQVNIFHHTLLNILQQSS